MPVYFYIKSISYMNSFPLFFIRPLPLSTQYKKKNMLFRNSISLLHLLLYASAAVVHWNETESDQVPLGWKPLRVGSEISGKFHSAQVFQKQGNLRILIISERGPWYTVRCYNDDCKITCFILYTFNYFRLPHFYHLYWSSPSFSVLHKISELYFPCTYFKKFSSSFIGLLLIIFFIRFLILAHGFPLCF